MISWDCFDTLIARRFKTPYSIFKSISETIDDNSFIKNRIEAEQKSPESLDSIYFQLSQDTNISLDKANSIKQIEIDTELSHCFPININLQKVKDGDIVVSDMYLPRPVIRHMLDVCGLRANINLYVSHSGKASGKIWNTLPKFEYHVGDNKESDVDLPKKLGYSTSYCNIGELTEIERMVGGNLGLLMRMIRLQNPYDSSNVSHYLWHDQSQYNIPLLILFSTELPKDNLCFSYRDCSYLQRIHEELKKTKNFRCHSSRISLRNTTKEYDTYLEDMTKGKIIVDLHGSGGSITRYHSKKSNTKPHLIYLTGFLTSKYENRKILLEFGDVVERFNPYDSGSLLEWPNKAYNENPKEHTEAIRGCVDLAIKCLPLFPKIYSYNKEISNPYTNWNPSFELISKKICMGMLESMVKSPSYQNIPFLLDHNNNNTSEENKKKLKRSVVLSKIIREQ